jgi:hypothetical protein
MIKEEHVKSAHEFFGTLNLTRKFLSLCLKKLNFRQKTKKSVEISQKYGDKFNWTPKIVQYFHFKNYDNINNSKMQAYFSVIRAE